MALAVLTVFIVISICLTIRAESIHSTKQLSIFKPLTMGCILSLVIVFGYHRSDLYFFAVISGLLFSLIGDVFLIYPERHFLKGLVSFLIAHLFYVVAFLSGRTVTLTLWLPFPLILYGMVILYVLKPHLGSMFLPVLIYMIIILIMTWQAWERWLLFQDRMVLCAAVGAVLFLISDSLLALNRFKHSFQMAEILILSTYFAAQYLIALSVQFN